MTKDHDDAAELLSIVLCKLNGIYPIDPIDGGANWIMFYNESKTFLDSLRKRGFTFDNLVRKTEEDK